MTAIFGIVFGPGDKQFTLPRIKTLIVDNDNNIGSRIFINSFSSPELADMFDIELVDQETADEMMASGRASALIIIPEHFSENLLKAEKSEFIVVKNPSEQFLPNIAEELMHTFGIIISGIVQAFEEEIKGFEQVFEKDFEKISVTDMIPLLEKSKAKIEDTLKYIDPPIIDLDSTTTKEEKDSEAVQSNIFSHILPGLSIMFIFFIIEIFLRDILTERSNGILQRMMQSPLKAKEIILARILSGWLMGSCVLLVMIAFGTLLFKISWGNIAYMLILSTATCFWISSFFALLNSFFRNKNQAGAFSAPIILIFAVFGGSFFDVSQFPAIFTWISGFTLNYWFIQASLQIINGIFPLLHISIIFISSIILFYSAAYFLNRRLIV